MAGLRYGMLFVLFGLFLPISLDAQPDGCNFLDLPECSSYTVIGSDGVETNLSSTSLPVSELVGACLEIRGDLIIDVPVYQVTNSDIIMAEKASIIIEDDNELIIRGSKFSAAETKAWRGLIAKDGRLEIMNCCISDAIKAVEPDYDAEVYLRQNYFDRNYYHVNNEEFSSSSGIVVVDFTVQSNTFDCSSPLIDAYDDPPIDDTEVDYTLAGLKLSYVDLKFPKTTMGDKNHFNNLMNGIDAFNSRLNVRNCLFENIQDNGIYHIGLDGYSSSLEQTGFGILPTYNNVDIAVSNINASTDIQKCVIKDSESGIRISRSPMRNIKIKDNYIEAVYYGIHLGVNDPALSLKVIKNQINISGSGVLTQSAGIRVYENNNGQPEGKIANNTITMSSTDAGIRLNGANSYKIRKNVIDIFGSDSQIRVGIQLRDAEENYFYKNVIEGETTSQSVAQMGIYSEASNYNRYKCNRVEKLSNGIRFRHNNLGTQLEKSVIDNCASGLVCEEGARIGDQRFNSNRWLNSFSNYKAFHAGPDGAIFGSLIFISDKDAGTVYDPYSPDPLDVEPQQGDPNQWIYLLAGGPAGEVCDPPEAEEDGPTRYPFQGSDTTIAMDEFHPPEYTEGYTWIARRYLYEKLMLDTTYEAEHSSFTTFLQSAAVDTVATYVDQRRSLRNIMTMDSSLISSVALHETHYSGYADSLQTFDSLYLDTNMTPSQQAERQQIMDKMQAEVSILDSLHSGWDDELNESLESWLTDWNASYTPNTPTANERYVVGAFVGQLTGNAFTDADYAQFLQIADQCPLAGGSAVYFARRLLEVEFDTVVLVGDCPRGGSKTTREISLSGLTIYPNPVDDRLQIEGLSEGERVYIFDIHGQPMDRFRVEDEKMSYRTGALPQGMYLIRTDRSQSGKFTVVR